MILLPSIVVPTESHRDCIRPSADTPCAMLGSRWRRMPAQMLKSVEFKLYPTAAQADTLMKWMGVCCWVYNRALENRIKAYKRRVESTSFIQQCAMLTEWRSRMQQMRAVPVRFQRDALRRVERGMKAFFRRVKAGEKPGFPRFRSRHRYNSLESLEASRYADGRTVRVPNLGHIRSRGPDLPPGVQRLMRVIRRASGWFAQVMIDDGKKPPRPKRVRSCIGIDVGLTHFATLSTGEKIDNPRWARTSERKVRAVQRRVSRRVKGSRNRRKAIRRLAGVHEKIAARRKDFCHQESRKLVNAFDAIGFENLNVRGLGRTRLAKSVMDAAWGLFTRFITYKAEYAGKQAVAVNARGTSQECPGCGHVVKKLLSERVHHCHNCGLVIDRDHASGMVIEARALRAIGAERLWRQPPLRPAFCWTQEGPVKQEG